jgi:hypothetical protein
VTLCESIISGSTSYSITTSVSALTLTMTSTVPCHKCGPPYATVTLSLVEISSSRQQKYGPISTSTSPLPYVVATSPPPRTYGAVPSSISEFGNTPNEGSRTVFGPANVVTISLAHVSQSYSAIPASVYESGSASSSNIGGIESAPANVVIVSLVRPPQPYVTTLPSIHESISTPNMENGITQTGSDNLSPISLGQPSETYGAIPTNVFNSVSNKNTESTLNSPVIGVTISLALPPHAYGGTGGGPPKSSALQVTPSYGPEESGVMSSGRSNTVLLASLSIPTPATIPGSGPGEGVVPNAVPSNTSLPVTPHYTYHGPLYTGSVDKGLRIFGGAGAVSLLVAVICGIIVA